MDDDLRELEAELRRLRPRAPSRRLEGRLEAKLGSERPLTRGFLRAAWLALPVAAAWLLAFAAMRRHSSSAAGPGTTDSFKPIAAENLLLDARDEGYVTLADGTTARRVRQSYLDTFTWRDPRTHASLTWSLPREEVRVVPVVFQ